MNLRTNSNASSLRVGVESSQAGSKRCLTLHLEKLWVALLYGHPNEPCVALTWPHPQALLTRQSMAWEDTFSYGGHSPVPATQHSIAFKSFMPCLQL